MLLWLGVSLGFFHSVIVSTVKPETQPTTGKEMADTGEMNGDPIPLCRGNDNADRLTPPPPAPPVRIRLEWDRQYYRDHIRESYAEPEVRLVIGETTIPPKSGIRSWVWDTFLSIYQSLGHIDTERLGDRKKDLEYSISNNADDLRKISFGECVYDVGLYPTGDEEMLCIRYESWDDGRKDRAIKLPLRDFVRGILDSNLDYFDQVAEIRAEKEVDESIDDTLEQVYASFRIIREWYYARWEPDPRPGDPLLAYRYLPPRKKNGFARFTPSDLSYNPSIFRAAIRSGLKLPQDVRRRRRRRPHFGFGRMSWWRNASMIGRYRRGPRGHTRRRPSLNPPEARSHTQYTRQPR
ncbi:hypothetical protein [Methanofollis fontis]|uniref:Uncharacterized protein n=1 Tax=Methanofollis fontis TaxID=2052832 RepID=A0A483CVM6_9EURY|nr:hypothetical protein [Methanofollis fontis]TAJ45567.1 hypothetical protein CUJ86_02245 [Methanofollis fontis]